MNHGGSTSSQGYIPTFLPSGFRNRPPAANDRTSFPEGEYRFRGVGAGNDKLAPQHRYSAKNQSSHTVKTLQVSMPG